MEVLANGNCTICNEIGRGRQNNQIIGNPLSVLVFTLSHMLLVADGRNAIFRSYSYVVDDSNNPIRSVNVQTPSAAQKRP